MLTMISVTDYIRQFLLMYQFKFAQQIQSNLQFSFDNQSKNCIMKTYDHEEDKESVQEPNPQQDQLRNFDEDYNYSKLNSQINQLNYQFKSHQSSIKKLQRDVQSRITESVLTETIALINSGIHSDPNIIKLLKTRQGSLQQQQNDKLKMNSNLFSRKLNQISQSLTVLLGGIKRVQSKLNLVETDLTSQMNQKFNSVQIQIEQVKGDSTKESIELQQKMELISYQLTDKLREMDTKLNWKLNQFKTKIDDKINQELVLIYLENTQKKIEKNMKQFQIKSNIDPERVDRIEMELQKNRLNAENGITQCRYSVSSIQKKINQEVLKLQLYEQDKIKIEKRLSLFNQNFMDVYKRVIKCEKDEMKMLVDIEKLLKDDEFALVELKRVNTVLINMKIGEDFQRMLQEMNPVKVLELQNTVDGVKDEQHNIFRQIAVAKRQIDIINAKSQIMGVMLPNKERQKLKKEELNEALNNFLIQNQFANKISNMDKQLTEYKISMDSITLLSRQVARLQKQSNYQKLSYEIKALEEMFKKQFYLLKNYNKEKSFIESNSFIERPTTNGRSSISNQPDPIGQAVKGRTFSVKKINQLSPFNNSQKLQLLVSKNLKEIKTIKN